MQSSKLLKENIFFETIKFMFCYLPQLKLSNFQLNTMVTVIPCLYI